MEVVMATGVIWRAKLQSIHHHQQTNIHLFTGRMPFLSPNQQCQQQLRSVTAPLNRFYVLWHHKNRCIIIIIIIKTLLSLYHM